MKEPTWNDVIAGLTGNRLKLWDDTLNVMPPSVDDPAAWQWLRANCLILRDGRAVRVPEAEALWRGGQRTETEDQKTEVGPARVVTSGLRAPSACPKQPTKGQLRLFG